ncbi:hypothetical protein [Nocardia salmonicida]|uniref:hypothetical protein n=1 Tax=Nocardia salmonicida TaxID=53431 RepID=UPI0007A3DEF8|nr:hypothetical protein [Nocardia salmonicida]
MNARAAGLPLDSSRPQSRAARREEAARLQAEQEAAAEQQPVATVVDEPAPKPVAPAAAPSVKIPMKKRADKRPFSTQLSSETTARLAWLVQQGGVLTDTIEAAVSTYLDAAGIPRPRPDGTMPTS